MNLIIARLRTSLTISSLCCVLAACSDDADKTNTSTSTDSGQDGDSLYLVHSAMQNSDGRRTNFFTPVRSLVQEQALDYETSLTLEGRSRLYAKPDFDFFALGAGEELTITRYSLGDDDEFVPGDSLSLQGFGVTSIDSRAVHFVSETKAYYKDSGQGQILVWNPKEMAVEESIELPKDLQKDGYIVNFSQWAARGDELYFSVYWTTEEYDRVLKGVALVHIDTKSNELTISEDTRCRGLNYTASVDGVLYFFSDVINGFGNAVSPGELGQASCALRIGKGETTFDQDYVGDVAGAVGKGHEATIIEVTPDGTAWLQVADLSVTKHEPGTTYNEWYDAGWSWHRVKLDTLEDAEPVGAEAGAYSAFVATDGNAFLISQSDDDYAKTTLVDLSSGEPKSGVSFPGFALDIARLR